MEKIEGYIEHIVFRSEETGYTVLNLISDDEEITCVGNFKFVDEGENVLYTGNFVDHPSYGKQFKVTDYEVKTPSDIVSIEKYLGSGAIKGIGPALAKRIVKTFGEDTFRVIEDEPEELALVKGISKTKAMEIRTQVIEKQSFRKVMVYLSGFGISMKMSNKIFERYGQDTIRVISENPYILCEDIEGIGFKTADEIAEKAGNFISSEYRIKSGILYTLSVAVADGHCYLPKQELINRAANLLSIDKDNVWTAVLNLAMDKRLIIKGVEDAKVYVNSIYYMELYIAGKLRDLNIPFPSDDEELKRLISVYEKREDISLEDRQKEAVLKTIKQGVTVITGGPGTGKTTVINMIIKYFDDINSDFFLAAPTGRAAKRMTEATGYEASTIQRLLHLTPVSDGEMNSFIYEKNEEEPLEADVIIIDEMSMVDIKLFNSLLKAVSVGTRLILVGDINQLPSVGPGSVLKDIIASGKFNVVELKKIFRQEEASHIVTNAHKINEGEHISLDNKSKDFFFIERNNIDLVLKNLVLFSRDKLPEYVNASPFDIQVLTPMKKGPLGVEKLNPILQKYLNPPEPSKREKEYMDTLYRVGDKVMHVKNNYDLVWEVRTKYGVKIDSGTGVFNGDIGVITDINEYAEIVTVEYDEGRRVDYTYPLLEELELAYAITIHKSQGSEYPAVIIPAYNINRMLQNRNLLYTAVTRAKNCVVIIGDKNEVYRMIDNHEELNRYTSLADRIREVYV